MPKSIAADADEGTWNGITVTRKFANEGNNSGWWQNAAADTEKWSRRGGEVTVPGK